jgi:hydrogenase maturation protein HypF
MNAPPATRLKIAVRGAVQGVGFRPFIFRLASQWKLVGWVNNSPQGVFIEVEGPCAALEKFLLRLEAEKPPRSFIQSLEASWLDPVGYAGFEIRESETGGDRTALILPDIATCPDCLREIFDPKNRRYRYPFTNCTHCGPRFSIIESLPYDRANTSMQAFTMCPQCQAEYGDPANRRFHAQPNACPVCGPHLELWRSGAGQNAANFSFKEDQPCSAERSYEALCAAAKAIRDGKIVAVKGLGGFHLMADARNDKAVRLLRQRKHREEKPFALMFPSLAAVKAVCEVSPLEERLLRSPESPIVLLRKLVRPDPDPLPQERESRTPSLPRQSTTAVDPSSLECVGTEDGCSLSPGERVRVRADVGQNLPPVAVSVAPNNPCLGAMLPYTPLHHLLLAELGFPVVATSGNLSDEPICTDEREALQRLGDIADVFLVHDRPIVRHVDDSIARLMLDRELVLRRARGYAPLPIQIDTVLPSFGHPLTAGRGEGREKGIVLAVGAHLKNAVALAVGGNVFISQHIGDLETEQANTAFRRVIADFEKLYEAQPQVVAADLHPDYLSTKFAREIVAQASSPAGSSGVPAAGSSPAARGRSANPPAGGLRYLGVQHHVAHVLSCMAENELSPPALGVSWDGTGYGLDGTIWGGEFFIVTDKTAERMAHFRPFQLPGGDQAVKEPRRVALGLLYEVFGDAVFERKDLAPVAAFSNIELSALKTMLAKKLNSPVTSSMGRLFDAVASLTGLRQTMRFEGQAAMELEFALDGIETDEAYDLPIANGEVRTAARGDARPTGVPDSALRTPNSPLVLDWLPMVEAILGDVNAGLSIGKISARFHNALVEAIVAVARQAGQNRIVLSGGCFQNRYLTGRAVRRLQAEGFRPYWHQRVPPNDGGIALGQVIAAFRDKD